MYREYAPTHRIESMGMAPFPERLNEQVAHEFAASQQYVAIAVWFDAETLPLLAAHFYRQALEERHQSDDARPVPAGRRPRGRDSGRRGPEDNVLRCARAGRARARAGKAGHRADRRARRTRS